MFDSAKLSQRYLGTSDTVSSWVFDELARRIVSGELSPAEKITEEALVKDLGASRTPMREAIKQLEELGLITRMRNRTLRIAPLQSSDLIELVKIREHLEGLIVSEVTLRFAQGEADTSTMWAIIREIENSEQHQEGIKRIDRIFDLGTAFHSELAVQSGMPRVLRMHSGIQLALARYRLVNAKDKRRLNHRSKEHRQILEAVESGDAKAAEHQMRNHIREGLKAYTSNAQPFALPEAN